MKKILLILGILVVATFAMAYMYFSSLHTQRTADELSLNVVAKSSGIVFAFENDRSFYEILSGQDLLQNLLGETKSKQLKALKCVIHTQTKSFNDLQGQKVYIGIVPDNKEQIAYLIATQTTVDPKAVLSHVKAKLKPLSGLANIYRFQLDDTVGIYLGVKDKLIIMSNAENVVRASLTKDNSDAEFSRYIQQNSQQTKNVLANVFIDFKRFPPLLKNILNTNLVGELEVFKRANAYASLTYNFSKDRLLLNGSTVINDNVGYESLFAEMPAQKQTITQILPAQTANYVAYSLLGYPEWQNKLNEWLSKNKENPLKAGHIISINEKYRLDLQQIFPKYFKNQLITFQLSTGEKLGAITLSNGEKVSQLLLDISDDYSDNIKIFKEAYIPYAFFGQPFKKFERPFYTIIDNYLVMANNASSISVFLSSYNANKLLINSDSYIEIADQLSSAGTICYYVDKQNSTGIFSRNLKMPYYKQYLAKTGFQSYTGLAYQLSSDNGKFQTNLLLNRKALKDLSTIH